jgi:hypothetical protein
LWDFEDVHWLHYLVHTLVYLVLNVVMKDNDGINVSFVIRMLSAFTIRSKLHLEPEIVAIVGEFLPW